MKTLKFHIFLLLLALPIFSFNSNETIQFSDNEVTAVYYGTSLEFQFEFIDENGKYFVFDEISKDVVLNLFTDEYIGKTFKISWTEKVEDVIDSKGEPTGETNIIRTITKLEIL